jgi:hypothetical protein
MGKVTRTRSAEATLDRVLTALEQELMKVPEEEILDAARSLGMNPEMKGSVLYAGVRFPSSVTLADAFDLEALRRAWIKRDPGPALGGPPSLRSTDDDSAVE